MCKTFFFNIDNEPKSEKKPKNETQRSQSITKITHRKNLDCPKTPNQFPVPTIKYNKISKKNKKDV